MQSYATDFFNLNLFFLLSFFKLNELKLNRGSAIAKIVGVNAKALPQYEGE